MTAQADDQDGDGGGVRLQATARHRRPARRRPRRRHEVRWWRAGTHGQEEPVGGRLRHVDLRTLSPLSRGRTPVCPVWLCTARMKRACPMQSSVHVGSWRSAVDVCTLQTTTLETDHPFSESFARWMPSVRLIPRASHGRIRQPTRPVLGGASLTLRLGRLPRELVRCSRLCGALGFLARGRLWARRARVYSQLKLTLAATSAPEAPSSPKLASDTSRCMQQMVAKDGSLETGLHP